MDASIFGLEDSCYVWGVVDLTGEDADKGKFYRLASEFHPHDTPLNQENTPHADAQI